MSEENEAIETQLEVMQQSALEAIERANIDIAISTARRYPRSLAIVKRRMMELATLDEETAASCFYKLNRQGKSIDGPSIRLAEIAASSFGNLRFGARVISNDGKMITAQGFAHDLESNVMSTIEVKRRITDKNGRTYSDDMQVVTGNAACAIAARNAIFKVVPFAFVKPVYLEARKAAVGDITTLADRRTNMLGKFAAMGINEKRLCASLGKAGIEEIGLSELEDLIGIYGAIRDNETTVDEAFPEAPAKPKFGPAIPETTGALVAEAKKEPETRKKTEPKKDAPLTATPLEGVRNLIAATPGIEEKDVMTYLFSEMKCDQGQTLDQVSEAVLIEVRDNWLPIVEQIKS